MQILCDSPSIQAALDTQAELTRLITGYVQRLSDYDDFSGASWCILLARDPQTALLKHPYYQQQLG